MARKIMIQGTMSNSGKSLIAAALCRIFRQDGYKVCPFKSQNMALNSYITEEGLEMGRAQVMQAQAAGIKPSAKMNPILLKPNSDTGSQVIVNGRVIGNMNAKEYFRNKTAYISDIMKSFHELEEEFDIIVIEGAGSPAEINLKQNDIVNMGFARMADAPVLLVGDIDPGGVFAQLYGTIGLLERDEQERIKGLIINKFRGDKTILDTGLTGIEKLTGKPVVGVIPYMRLDIDDEDSMSGRLGRASDTGAVKLLDIVVIRLPRISNFTDFAPFEQIEYVNVRYVDSVKDFGSPDMIIIPGTKSTINDLLWMRENGIEAVIQREASRGKVIFGVCGGYQMLGVKINDEKCVEFCENNGEKDKVKEVAGMGLLPIQTSFDERKHVGQVKGRFAKAGGIFTGLEGIDFEGYELHNGVSSCCDRTDCDGGEYGELTDCGGMWRGNIYGTYVHGIFDSADVSSAIVSSLLKEKGIDTVQTGAVSRREYLESQYDELARIVRENLDMEVIYKILN